MTKPPVLSGDALKRRAAELGVSMTGAGTYMTPSGPVSYGAEEHELQRRVLEAERHVRDGRLWIVALVSAVASVVSAAAAWVAIFFHA